MEWVLFGVALVLLLYSLLAKSKGVLPFAVPALLGAVGTGVLVVPDAAGKKLPSGWFEVLNGLGRVATWVALFVALALVAAQVLSRKKNEPRRMRRWGGLFGSLAALLSWWWQGGVDHVTSMTTSNLTLAGGALVCLVFCAYALFTKLKVAPTSFKVNGV